LETRQALAHRPRLASQARDLSGNPFEQEDQMGVVGHEGVGADLDGEDAGELAESLQGPVAPVLLVGAGDRIAAAEPGAAAAAGLDVDRPLEAGGDQPFAWEYGHMNII
jgi:hypothetical protein